MSLASYEAPPRGGPERFFVAFEVLFLGFARVLLSANEFLPFATESPDRRPLSSSLQTSVGALNQVHIRIPV